jgi:transcriptional regulator with XRE-family HTH domain
VGEANQFGRRLAELRRGAGLTQEELAARAGLSASGVIHLENGHRAPRWDTVRALCQALGVTCQAFEVAPADEAPRPRGRPKKPPPGAPPAKPTRKRGRKTEGDA